MKLGICYMVFDGEELLEFAIKAIRNNVDFISATYQDISYHGNKADPQLFQTLSQLKSEGLIDELIFYDTDLTLHHKENEVRLRNLGLEASRKAGCTHHISLDADEFFDAQQLEFAKKEMEKDDYDFSVVPIKTYYKDPTFLVYPVQDLIVSFIHPVTNQYTKEIDYPIFPFHMETTRRFVNHRIYRVFKTEECVMHHMSYVRKDMRKKFKNNDNKRFYKVEKFLKAFDEYKLGGRVCLLPDYLNRRTTPVDNKFNIHF